MGNRLYRIIILIVALFIRAAATTISFVRER